MAIVAGSVDTFSAKGIVVVASPLARLRWLSDKVLIPLMVGVSSNAIWVYGAAAVVALSSVIWAVARLSMPVWIFTLSLAALVALWLSAVQGARQATLHRSSAATQLPQRLQFSLQVVGMLYWEQSGRRIKGQFLFNLVRQRDMG